MMKMIDCFDLLSNSIEIQKDDLETKLLDFEVGYKYSNNKNIHSLSLQGYIHIIKRHKVLIEIIRISTVLILIDLNFFASEFDVEEWQQIGIKSNEYIVFYQFLDELSEIFNFKIGCVEIEDNVLSLFDVFVEYPNEQYNFDNLDFSKVKNNQQLLYIKLNEN